MSTKKVTFVALCVLGGICSLLFYIYFLATIVGYAVVFHGTFAKMPAADLSSKEPATVSQAGMLLLYSSFLNRPGYGKVHAAGNRYEGESSDLLEGIGIDVDLSEEPVDDPEKEKKMRERALELMSFIVEKRKYDPNWNFIFVDFGKEAGRYQIYKDAVSEDEKGRHINIDKIFHIESTYKYDIADQ